MQFKLNCILVYYSFNSLISSKLLRMEVMSLLYFLYDQKVTNTAIANKLIIQIHIKYGTFMVA